MALAKTEDLLSQLENHLASQRGLKEREGTFDMEDGPETRVLAPFQELHTALLWLETALTGAWRSANQEALRSQSHHRRLARIAIGAGTAAIILAIAQPPIKLTLQSLNLDLPGISQLAKVLEVIAVVAGVTAVAVGLKAKFDRRWLGQRHRAERLRMLKFRSLGQLWNLEFPVWQELVTKELAVLEDGDDPEDIDEWLSGELVEPFLQDSLKFEPAPATALALSTYYRFKRVEFQASYFNRRREDFEKESGPWLHLSLPFFLASVACVLIHFVLEFAAKYLHNEYMEVVALWFVAFAAIIPVLGIGMRAWFAAFELPRSANLFAAKYRALQYLKDRLNQDAGELRPTLNHMARAEYFLEQEHREWLRLLRDTEWFL